MAERCKIHRVPLDDVERGIDDPGLAELVAKGWTIAGQVLGKDKHGDWLLLVMQPPATNLVQVTAGPTAAEIGRAVVEAMREAAPPAEPPKAEPVWVALLPGAAFVVALVALAVAILRDW